MGGLTCLLPTQTIALSVHDPPKNAPMFRVVWQCFGSQACLAGLLLTTSTMDRRAFLLWAMAMMPYIFFNFYCLCVAPGELFTPLGVAGDFAGNAVFFSLSLYAWWRLGGEETKKTRKKQA